MSLHYLGKHKPQNCVFFSHALYRISITILLSKHAVGFIFSDEKVLTVASLVHLQNDRDCAASNVKKCDVAHEHLLRCQPA